MKTPARRTPAAPALRRLREQVLWANVEIARRDLARFTFGNASAIDRERGLVVIKPSGVPYDQLTANSLVVTDLDGRVVAGQSRASSDLPTHLVLYDAFGGVDAIVHTHSHFATVWAQAGREIPCFGTTHADYFHGAVPLTRPLSKLEIDSAYEANTGESIVRRFAGLDPLRVPAVLVVGHGSFCWGPTVGAAVETASALEEVAHLAFDTIVLNAEAESIADTLREKHFSRKHGAGAYYGQTPGERK